MLILIQRGGGTWKRGSPLAVARVGPQLDPIGRHGDHSRADRVHLTLNAGAQESSQGWRQDRGQLSGRVLDIRCLSCHGKMGSSWARH